MDDNKAAKRCGAEQLLAILSHGRMESEARDYIQHVLGNPTLAGYSQGDDIPGELEGVTECLAYIRKAWKQVGTADGLILQLQAQLPNDGDTEPCEEPPNEEPDNIPVEDDNPEDGKPIVEVPDVHNPPGKGGQPIKGDDLAEDPGQPDSFDRGKSKLKGKSKRVK